MRGHPGSRQVSQRPILRPARARQRHGGRSTWNMPPLVAGACADRLSLLSGSRRRSICTTVVDTPESLPGGDHQWQHHLPCPTVLFDLVTRAGGGERWVAQTGVAGHGRIGHWRRSAGNGRFGHRRAVATPTRGGPGRGAGRSAGRPASARPRSASSCCRRIHSASTIAAASSSRVVARAVQHTTSRTPSPRRSRPGPAVEVDRVRR